MINNSSIKNKIFWLLDAHYKIIKSSEETNGKYCIVEGYFKPNYIIPLHVHKTVDEFFLVIDGKLEFQHENKKIVLNEGDGVFVKKSMPHSIKNINNDKSSKLICLVNQGDFENFFIELGTEVPNINSEPVTKITLEKIAEMSKKYGTEMVQP